tara:strand:- start:113 stop:997 length:885 start_codon:yes stop_codon:yes gene_type:complete
MKTAIISGCDNNYFYKYLNLYNSLIDNNCFEQADLCFVNISISDNNLKKISHRIKKIVEPKWDFKIPFKTQEWKKLLTIRPFLKNYFPGYDNYIWLDADTWVQGNDFISDFINVCSMGKISIVPEYDINYEALKMKYSFKKIFSDFYQAKGWSYKNLKKYFDKETLNKLHQKPILNAGVFSLPSNSIIWEKWKNEYKKIVELATDDYCLNMDQASLNKVLYNNLDLVNFFNSEYNYLIKNCLPIIDNDGNFCLKDFPFNKIKIIHLTQIEYEKEYSIKTINQSMTKKKFTHEKK